MEDNTNNGTAPSNAEETKKYSQEDVNNIVTKKSREAIENVLKDLGVEDVKSAKEGLKAFKESQEAQKTELQKMIERNQTLEKEIEAYKLKELTYNNIESIKSVLAENNIESKYAKTVYKLMEANAEINKDTVMTTIQEELPMLMNSEETIKIGVEKGNKKPTSSIDDYLSKKYANNPFFKK